MKRLLQRAWMEQDGVLTFEWVMLVTLLCIGIVGGIASVRDAIIDELGDIAQAILCVDQSYTISHPLSIYVKDMGYSGASDSMFINTGIFADCNRNDNFDGQTGHPDLDFDDPA